MKKSLFVIAFVIAFVIVFVAVSCAPTTVRPTAVPVVTVVSTNPVYNDCKIVKTIANGIMHVAYVVECDQHVCVLSGYGGAECWEMER